jgi:hypothetical protein
MEALAALRPAVPQIGILMNMRLVQVNQQMTVARGAVQHRLQALQQGLPLGRVEQLPGLLPGQFQPMQRGADGLPAHPPTNPLLDPLHQPPQRGGGACSTVGGRAAAAWAHLTEAGLDLGAKGGRVR